MLHEKLYCYQMALELAQDITRETGKWRSGYGYLSDQIKRAISSVVLNCAEGNARSSLKERKRFFQIARASLVEVSACADLMISFEIISLGKYENWKGLLNRVSKMLYFLR